MSQPPYGDFHAELINDVGPRYAITMTPCRWGWTAECNLGPGQLLTMVEPPVYWRPTREAALKRAQRTLRAWRKADARRDRTEIVVDDE